MKCPNCGANVSVPPGATRVTCDYCHANLSVEVDQGEAVLQSTERITEAIKGQGQQTVTELQRMELMQQRSQLSQQLSSLQIHEDTLRSELWSLERMRKDRKAREEIGDLRARMDQLNTEESSLRTQIADIDKILYPGRAEQLANSIPQAASNQATGSLPRALITGCVVWFIVIFALTVCLTEFGVSTSSTNGQSDPLMTVAMILAVVIGIVGFYFAYYPSRRRDIIRRLQQRKTNSPNDTQNPSA
jgi:LSD1 subclass zinc finger protein